MTVAHDIQSQGSSEVKICFFPPYFSQGSHRNLSLFRSGRMEVASRCYCHAHLSFLMKKNAAAPFPERRSKYSGQSVRAIPVRVLTVGKRRSQGVQLLVEEYKEKLKNYCSIEDVLIKSNPKNTGNVKAQIEAEDMLIMQQIKPGEWVVVLDEHGADIGSEQMADLVGDVGTTGSSRLVFCIGGPYGHGQQVRDRADVIIRLSSMVLNHQIALIVLLEQLYRAWTIIKGQKYHH
ncbi:putative RNA methyltransferase At5g10620 isoform X2 [Phoenix dactylifera]|uniref:RNA methyltransferase At5g10620 isoform X2 n=1 Tax=Phoenix dactylifera TaxID=42345 RepID=A0A8B7BMU5_PHODC|nr:putative RNA methyltransferase At5g10620 isoform X2 [Phoenix dactylifera]